MKKILVLFVILVYSIALFSQVDRPNIKFPKYAVGISPSAAINFFEGVQVSNDIGLNDYFNLNLETAYLFGSLNKDRVSNGFRIRPSIEYLPYVAPGFAYIIGFFGLNRFTKEEYFISVSHFEERYNEQIPVIRNKTLYGGGFLFGLMSRINDKILFKFRMGIGGGSLAVEEESSIEDRDFRWNFFNNFDSVGDWQYPIVFTNINFSYIIVRT